LFGQYKSRQKGQKGISCFGSIFGFYGSNFSRITGLPFLPDGMGQGKKRKGAGGALCQDNEKPDAIGRRGRINLRRLKNWSQENGKSF